MSTYKEFLASKSQLGRMAGFEPTWLPDFLHGFQGAIDDWAIRKGRASVNADCGLGKSPMELVWAANVIRHTNQPVLLATPLAVGPQMVREGEKFGVECHHSRDGKFPSGARVVVTNYEQLEKFTPSDFAGMVCDEAGCLKDFDSVTRNSVVEFMRTLPYRLVQATRCQQHDARQDLPRSVRSNRW